MDRNGAKNSLTSLAWVSCGDCEGGRETRLGTHIRGVDGGDDRLLLEIDAAIHRLEFNLNHLEEP